MNTVQSSVDLDFYTSFSAPPISIEMNNITVCDAISFVADGERIKIQLWLVLFMAVAIHLCQ